ncbi:MULTISPECIES: hypothetical protein [unclassified Bradyrhizobium]|uniref:hypothetical protein n=1 Tax=unclassified Bradyrhizobium TaxID=2631580 RepID=UPI002449E034|nr:MULTISPECIES: hypothetical protein [unclassified Bradyrhizobium]MDH2345886.1 hypothetical protein [Bradyrhizobium sp. SSUT77]MDH2354016.1 hypothetical protein [Bradyrhizobium sp. SSUT112]
MVARSGTIWCRSLLYRAWRAWLFAASMVACSWPSAAGAADELARPHDREIQDMVAASVGIETGFNSIFDGFRRKIRSDPGSPDFRTEGRLNQDCYNFVHARFYAKYRKLLDSIDISRLSGFSDLRRDRTDKSVLRDPRKIAYETNYLISSFKFLKDFHPPLDEFVVRYSARPDLETKCMRYLDLTGTRN